MGLLSRLRKDKAETGSTSAEEIVTYEVIGRVRNGVTRLQQDGWEFLESEVVLREDLPRVAEGIEGFSHVIVLFHLDRVPPEEKRLRVTVGNEERPPERGVLATRSQRRPNPLAVSVVKLLDRDGAVLRVKGLDAVDGTPVLDVKPYLPEYDAVPGATLPFWAEKPR